MAKKTTKSPNKKTKKTKAKSQPKELTFNHRPVEYSFCNVKINNPRLFVSDPWGILRGHLSSLISKSNNGARKKYQRSLNYASQAEQFSKAARVTELPTKATLSYYAMTNLAKSYLVFVGLDPGSHHGLAHDRDTNKVKLVLDEQSTFKNLSIALNGYYSNQPQFSFSDLASRIIEIHKLYSLWIAKTAKLKFLPIQISFIEESSNFSMRILIENKDKSNYDIDKFLKHGRQDRFRKISDTEYRLLRARKLNYSTLEKKINELVEEMKDCNFIDLLDNDNYAHYCYLGETTFHHLCYPYLLMFFVGYLARYQPELCEKLMDGEEYALVNEAVNLCIPQFTYQMVSRFLNRKCVLPKGSGIIVA